METNLRTLNEIFELYNHSGNAQDMNSELKQEAIKWIKAIETPTKKGDDWDQFDLPGNYCLESNYHENDYPGARTILMSFFNLTEVDIQASILADKVDEEVARQLIEDI